MQIHKQFAEHLLRIGTCCAVPDSAPDDLRIDDASLDDRGEGTIRLLVWSQSFPDGEASEGLPRWAPVFIRRPCEAAQERLRSIWLEMGELLAICEKEGAQGIDRYWVEKWRAGLQALLAPEPEASRNEEASTPPK